MEILWEQISSLFGVFLPKLVLACSALLLGWILAKILESLVFRALSKIRINERVTRWTALDADAPALTIDRPIAIAIFLLVMLISIGGFFKILNFDTIAAPLNGFTSGILAFTPNLISAILLGTLAWVIAGLVRMLILRTVDKVNRNATTKAWLSDSTHSTASLTKALSDTAFWLVLLIFLPAILAILRLEAVLDPIEELVAKLLALTPDIIGAALVGYLGWHVARLTGRVIVNIGETAKVATTAESGGFSWIFADGKTFDILARVIHIIVFIPFIVAALDIVDLKALTGPTSDMIQRVIGVIPLLFAAVSVIFIAYVVGRVVAEAVEEILLRIGINKIPGVLGLNGRLKNKGPQLSEIIRRLTLSVIVLTAAMEACDMLQFRLTAELLHSFFTFISRAALAVVIIGIAIYLAGLLSDMAKASGIDSNGSLSVATRITVIAVGATMSLQHLGVAGNIIELAFGIVLGSIAIAAAIAFGWGGRELAGELLKSTFKKDSRKKLI